MSEKKGIKITVVGAGNVGATIAYALAISGLASEIVITDINQTKAEGEALDIQDGASMLLPVNVRSGDYKQTKNSDIVVISAGLGRKPGMTRIDLCNTNIEIIKTIVPQVTKYSPNAIYVVVSNPADVLTYATLKISGLPVNQVIGSGTLLDSSRLRSNIAKQLNVPDRDVNACVLGEHGDSSMIPWSIANIAGIKFKDYCDIAGRSDLYELLRLDQFLVEMRKGGASVIQRKGATFYAIGLSVRTICQAILRDEKTILPVASLVQGTYGIEDVCLSLLHVVGANGIENVVPVDLTDEELILLQTSGKALKDVLSKLTF